MAYILSLWAVRRQLVLFLFAPWQTASANPRRAVHVFPARRSVPRWWWQPAQPEFAITGTDPMSKLRRPISAYPLLQARLPEIPLPLAHVLRSAPAQSHRQR